MKGKIWIATIKTEDIERRAVRCFDDAFIDVSNFCGYLSTLDLGKFVFRLSNGEIEVETNFDRQKRLKQHAASASFKHNFRKKLRLHSSKEK